MSDIFKNDITRSQRDSGFTIIEVVVAVVILAFCIFATTALWSSNLSRVRKAQLLHNIASLLEKKVTELEVEYKNKTLAEIPEERKGDFGSEFKQYRWEMKSQPLEIPDLSAVIIKQTGQIDDFYRNILQTGFAYLSTATKEVKVSIFVKIGKKESEYSVTTYFVDYATEFNMGGI